MYLYVDAKYFNNLYVFIFIPFHLTIHIVNCEFHFYLFYLDLIDTKSKKKYYYKKQD